MVNLFYRRKIMGNTRYEYKENVEKLADTILWELTQTVVRNLEREKNNPNSEWHWKNSCVYSEFVRRNKVGAYFNAHNRALGNIGKEKSAIFME